MKQIGSGRRTLLRSKAVAACCVAYPHLEWAQEMPEAAKLTKEMAKYLPNRQGRGSFAGLL
jgi:hypothetical protein